MIKALFLKIASWFRKKVKTPVIVDYSVVHTDAFPKDVNSNRVYVIQDGNVPDTIIIKCPCGCQSDIFLNLLKDTNPCWRFYLDKGQITITPSVWRTVGCRSHFFVREGKIVWAKGDM